MIRSITAYRDSKGKIHETKEAALLVDIELALAGEYDGRVCIARRGSARQVNPVAARLRRSKPGARRPGHVGSALC
jgi:hypothetical protein